jgi:hypothetical protein
MCFVGVFCPVPLDYPTSLSKDDNRRPSLTQLMRACTRKSELPNCTPWHPQVRTFSALFTVLLITENLRCSYQASHLW